MTFLFKPAIYRNSVLSEFPQPVVNVKVQDAWDAEQFKVPLSDGDSLSGHSRQGVNIAIKGRIETAAGSLKTTEQAMFTTIETLRAVLDVSSDGDKFEFFLYHDDVGGLYRKFKNCSAIRFEYDLSDKNEFAYSAVIHAEDPVIYSTAPGA